MISLPSGPSEVAATAIAQVQAQVRRRLLRLFVRRGLLPADAARAMAQWDDDGGFSVDGSVCIAAADRAGRERLLRYCARPPFALGDDVAPWQSVYKLHLLTDTEATFLLTSGGHNAGIVSEPGHPGRHYRVASRKSALAYADPDVWAAQTPTCEGSWWPVCLAWLAQHSGAPVPPPPMGAADARGTPLCDAPGSYVLQA